MLTRTPSDGLGPWTNLRDAVGGPEAETKANDVSMSTVLQVRIFCERCTKGDTTRVVDRQMLCFRSMGVGLVRPDFIVAVV